MNVVRAKNENKTDMRTAYGPTLVELAKEDKRIAVLDADLVVPIGTTEFQKTYPDRMIDCGIQEANMIGVAAGMSARGMVPFAHTFACFVARKCLDQIYLSAGFAGLNVKIVGSDPGILALYNGASHMALEDMGILRNIPDLTLIEVTDATMLRSIVTQIKDIYGLHYIRLNRKTATDIYDTGTTFEIGKGLILEDGDDATVISSGIMVEESLKAAAELKKEGISVRVIDLFTWQPLDEALILESAKKTGAIVVAENHRKATGLGSAIAPLLAERHPVPMGFIGVGQVYGEVGTQDYLMDLFNLNAADIVAKVKETVARK